MQFTTVRRCSLSPTGAAGATSRSPSPPRVLVCTLAAPDVPPARAPAASALRLAVAPSAPRLALATLPSPARCAGGQRLAASGSPGRSAQQSSSARCPVGPPASLAPRLGAVVCTSARKAHAAAAPLSTSSSPRPLQGSFEGSRPSLARSLTTSVGAAVAGSAGLALQRSAVSYSALPGHRGACGGAGKLSAAASPQPAGGGDVARHIRRLPNSIQHPLAAFLQAAGLFQYLEPLLRSGFDDLETLCEIEDRHLQDLGMPPGHVLKLRRRLRELPVDAGSKQVPAKEGVGAPAVGRPSAAAVALVTLTWDRVASAGVQVLGELLFRHLFKADPDALNLFAFRHTTQIYDSQSFRQVAAALVAELDACFRQPSEPPLRCLERLAEAEAPVGEEAWSRHYAAFGEALILVVQAGLQSNFCREVEVAWREVYAFVTARPRSSSKACPCAVSVGQLISGGREVYRIDGHLQKAIFGDVFQATGLVSGGDFAVKAVDSDTVREVGLLAECPLSEVRFADRMRGLPHVAQMEDHFLSDQIHFVVLRLARGGDLLEMLKKRHGGFCERQARDAIRQVAAGLAGLHDKGLAMQDVSLENMLVYLDEESDDLWRICVCDPGQAVPVTFDPQSGAERPVPFHGFVGKQFRPPELYRQGMYMATKVDSWCLGWSTFYLLVAQPMFLSADPAVNDADWGLFARQAFSQLFAQKGWRSTMSHEAKDFILQLMDEDPERRLSMHEALRHPWLAGDAELALPMPGTSLPEQPADSTGAGGTSRQPSKDGGGSSSRAASPLQSRCDGTGDEAAGGGGAAPTPVAAASAGLLGQHVVLALPTTDVAGGSCRQARFRWVGEALAASSTAAVASERCRQGLGPCSPCLVQQPRQPPASARLAGVVPVARRLGGPGWVYGGLVPVSERRLQDVVWARPILAQTSR